MISNFGDGKTLVLFAVLLMPQLLFAATGINSCSDITKPGDYELRRNINGNSLTNLDVACINILAPQVNLNLNGYSIGRPVPAMGDAPHAINIQEPQVNIRNGFIGPNFDWGIVTDLQTGKDFTTVEDVKFVGNEGGVYVGNFATVRRLTVDGAGLNRGGIFVGNGSLVADNLITSPTSLGIGGDNNVTIINNRIINNQGTGIEVGQYSVIRDNHIESRQLEISAVIGVNYPIYTPHVLDSNTIYTAGAISIGVDLSNNSVECDSPAIIRNNVLIVSGGATAWQGYDSGPECVIKDNAPDP